MLTNEDKKSLKKDLLEIKDCYDFIKSKDNLKNDSYNAIQLELACIKISYYCKIILSSFRKERLLTKEEKNFFKPGCYLSKDLFEYEKIKIASIYHIKRKLPDIDPVYFNAYERCNDLLGSVIF